MKRKLISFDVFKKIEESSLTNAQNELIGAEEVLARTLGVDDLKLFTFGESDVTYQANDGNFVHASYTINKEQLVLENIEQLIIEEESEKKNARQLLVNMVDSLVENNEMKAAQVFDAYISMPLVRRNLVNEGFKEKSSKVFDRKKGSQKKEKHHHSKMMKSMSSKERRKFLGDKDCKMGKSKNPRWKTYMKKMKPSSMKEWSIMCENVMKYIDYKEFGPVISESQIKTDERGNIVAVAIPTSQKRNEGKILSFNYNTLDHELKVLRGKVKKLSENQIFVKAMADLKRYNNISDNNGLEETLEAIVTHFPDVLYVTQNELASQISTALETANVNNYDDATCEFMAEAILRTAHNTYTDRVKKIGVLAGATTDVSAECNTCSDPYQEFRVFADILYSKLDESDEKELKVFSDLFKALNEIYRMSTEIGDEVTKAEVENYMENCVSILNREKEIDLELAESITNYLSDLIEANVDGSDKNWNVSNNTHISVNGDHPRTAMNASVGDAVPSRFPGDWGDPAPVSDGKSYKNGLANQMRSSALGNHSDGDEWPELSNPYIPKSGEFKMKEKSAVNDGENDFSRFQSNDTWPNLKNPYIPDSPMNSKNWTAKSDNLVVKPS
jgi:hypothetical protein